MTSPKIFKPEDFSGELKESVTGYINAFDRMAISKLAQSIFEAWLKEHGKVIKFREQSFENKALYVFNDESDFKNATHQALLINIQEN